MPPADPFRAAALLVAAIMVTFALFALWPGLDLAVSRLFYRPGAGFPVESVAWAEALRLALWRLSMVMVLASAVFLLLSTATGRAPFHVSGRVWGFVLAVYALGTGVLVHGLLKAYWGRARPAQVTEFGGGAAFTPPWQISQECTRNCSFVSGEVSGAVAFSVGLWAILTALDWRLPPVWQRRGRVVAVVIPLLTGLQRLAAGRHFLSDVVLSALFTLLIAVLLSPLLPRRHAPRG